MNKGEEECSFCLSMGVKNVQTYTTCEEQGVQLLMYREKYSPVCGSRYTEGVFPDR